MASARETLDRQAGRDQEPSTANAEDALHARLSRKRTKTGCLTCRKRRIKCDEGQPTCGNCQRSRRKCEGYSLPVVAKKPTLEFRQLPNGAQFTFPADMSPEVMMALMQTTAEMYDPTNACRQSSADPLSYVGVGPGSQWHPYGTYDQACMQQDAQQSTAHLHLDPTQQGFVHGVDNVPRDALNDSIPLPAQQVPHSASWPPDAPQISLPIHTTGVPQPHYGMHLSSAAVEPAQIMPYQWSAGLDPSTRLQPMYQQVNQLHDGRSVTSYHSAGHLSYQLDRSRDPDGTSPEATSHGRTSPRSVAASLVASYTSSPASFDHGSAMGFAAAPNPEDVPDRHEHHVHVPVHGRSNVQVAAPSSVPYLAHAGHEALSVPFDLNDMLAAAAVETQDDDYYDVGPDDMMSEQDDSRAVPPHREDPSQATLNKILSSHPYDVRLRRYDAYIHAGILDAYRVERSANPLRNEATRRVFAHFISATGPNLSVFERHHGHSSALLRDGSVAARGLWTHTLPMAALHHQGLLHAMLAIASLHIARIQHASITPSMQHYAWALKRVHHCVGHAKKRLEVTTIAASLLLGYYEVMTADHMKWNMHLAGSKQLLVETDFAAMTKQVREMQRKSRLRQAAASDITPRMREPTGLSSPYEVLDVDERMVSAMVSREVRYDAHGRVDAASAANAPSPDLGKFEILQDLYWWFCKQDAYQSIISGNPLLMDFGRWTDCPPRAPLGKPDAVYGSFDHLVLVLGRIAQFASKDRTRKLKQIEVNGGQWRPPAAMRTSPPGQLPRLPKLAAAQAPSNAGPPAAGSSFPGPPPPPLFYGMTPSPAANVDMPASYRKGIPASRRDPQAAPTDPHFDLEAATEAAKAEHSRIKAALVAFRESLGNSFRPLTAQQRPPFQTAFGPATFYASIEIACLWAAYHMAEIVAIRSHPDMPPAAHMAAGIAAAHTRQHAEEIGRITAGLYAGVSATGALNPALGAALCESCVPSFFAAIQYADLAQRHETVRRIDAIARRTGWGTADLIANGCETAWVKAAEMGRGPPYARVLRTGSSDDPRLNGEWERADPAAVQEVSDEVDRRMVRLQAKAEQSQARLFWGIGVIGREGDFQV